MLFFGEYIVWDSVNDIVLKTKSGATMVFDSKVHANDWIKESASHYTKTPIQKIIPVPVNEDIDFSEN